MQVVESHVHFWQIGAPGQSWPDPGLPLIYRDFGSSDLMAAASGIELQAATGAIPT